MYIRKSDAALRRLRHPLLWLLCLCLAFSAVPADALMQIKSPSNDKEWKDCGADETVWVGESVRLRVNNIGHKFSWTKDGEALPGADDPRSVTVSSNVEGTATYRCSFERLGSRHERAVTLTFTNPTELSLAQISGSSVLLPGESVQYMATCPQPKGYADSAVHFDWKVVDGNGEPLPDEGAFTLTAANGMATLALHDGADAWKLSGARIACTASLAKNPWLRATKSVDVPAVGVKVVPAESAAAREVPAVLKGGNFVAGLEPDFVTGGGAPADRLVYRWQYRDSNSDWRDAGGSGKTFAVSVPEAQWTDREYRCIIGEGPTGAVSGIFRVTDADVRLVLSGDVRLTPTSAVVLNSGAIEVAGTVHEPANRAGDPGNTLYGRAVEVLNGDWETLPGTFRTEKGAMNAGSTLRASFTPLEGTHQYRMTVSSDADDRAVDHSRPFAASLVNTDNTKVQGISNPLPDEKGNIVVTAGQNITYSVRTQGGTGKWFILWANSTGQSRAEGRRWTDDLVTHGQAVSATAVVMTPGGNLPVNDVAYVRVTFGTPFVALEWSPRPVGEAIVDYAEISGDRSVELLRLSAQGGTGRYTCAYAVSDREPVGDSGWTPMKNATFSVTESMLQHDFSDGKSAYIPIWFRVVCGNQSVTAPVTLIVVQEPTIVLDSGGGNLKHEDGAYTWLYNENLAPKLNLSLISGDCENPTFRWTLKGFKSTEGDTWTPPEGLKASKGPYEVTLEVLSGDRTIMESKLRLEILPPLSAAANFSDASVLPGESTRLTIRATKTGSKSLTFRAGPEGGSMEKIAPNGDLFAELEIRAASIPGVYPYRWSLTDDVTGAVVGGIVELTAEDLGGVKFLIRPDRETEFVEGGSFDMVLQNVGTPAVGPDDVTWSSDSEAVAQVSGSGHVSLRAPGEACIAATLKTSPDIRATFDFTVRKASPKYRIEVPELNFAPGAKVYAQFLATPADATLSALGLPEGLQLDATGALTGAAPEKTGNVDFSVTAVWPNQETLTVDATLHVTGDNEYGDDGDSGGGCNAGFGIFVSVLCAFPMFRRFSIGLPPSSGEK